MPKGSVGGVHVHSKGTWFGVYVFPVLVQCGACVCVHTHNCISQTIQVQVKEYRRNCTATFQEGTRYQVYGMYTWEVEGAHICM